MPKQGPPKKPEDYMSITNKREIRRKKGKRRPLSILRNVKESKDTRRICNITDVRE